MLASCLNQIEDDRDLVASAKCLIQSRHRIRKTDQSAETQSFITINDSGKKDDNEKLFKSDDYGRKNVAEYHRMNATEKIHISPPEIRNKFPMQHSFKTSVQSSESSNILYPNHIKNFTLDNFSTFKHSTIHTSVSHSSNLSRKVYLNRLIPFDRKSMHINLMPTKHSTEENETFKTLHSIEDEIEESTNITEQSFNSPDYEKVNRKGKHRKKSELVENINLPEKVRNFQRNDWYVAAPSSSSSEHSQKLHSTSILSKFGIKKPQKRQRRSYRLITNHVMKSDHLIVDVSDYSNFIIFHTFHIIHITSAYYEEACKRISKVSNSKRERNKFSIFHYFNIFSSNLFAHIKNLS